MIRGRITDEMIWEHVFTKKKCNGVGKVDILKSRNSSLCV